MRTPLSQRGESRIYALRKSAGSQGQPKLKDHVLICHSLKSESQEAPVMGGYLNVKVSIFQIQDKEPVPWAYLHEICFKVIILKERFIRAGSDTLNRGWV